MAEPMELRVSFKHPSVTSSDTRTMANSKEPVSSLRLFYCLILSCVLVFILRVAAEEE